MKNPQTNPETKEMLDSLFRSALQLAELAEAPEERYMATLAWQHTLAITEFLGYAVRLEAIGGHCQVELVPQELGDIPVQQLTTNELFYLRMTWEDEAWLRAMQISLTEPTPSLSPESEGT